MQELIPKNKFDIQTAKKLKLYSYGQIQSIVPNLLEWIQDLNWPVSKPVADYLQTISENITDEIVIILNGNDDVWKYWCLHIFGLWTDKRPTERLLTEFSRIANNTTKGEIEEGVQEIAIALIEKNNAP